MRTGIREELVVLRRELRQVGILDIREVGADVVARLREEEWHGGKGEERGREESEREGTGAGEDGGGEAGDEDVDDPGCQGLVGWEDGFHLVCTLGISAETEGG